MSDVIDAIDAGHQIRCDGCDERRPPREIVCVADLGHEMRYCADCLETWRQFEVAQHAEAARHQRLLELWQEQARRRCPLKLTPLDLPVVVRAARGQPLVLG